MESAEQQSSSELTSLAFGGDHIQLALEENMKISKLVIPAAAAALLMIGGAAVAQTKKPINTSAGAGAPMNFPTPMPNENGDYT
jgi:hypothetical protein